MADAPPQHAHDVDALFDAAIDLPSAEHEDFLRRACGEDDGMRREVAALLAAYHETQGVLGRPVGELAAPILRDILVELATSRPGGRVGPFRLVRTLGEGGMGEVFLAERDDGQFEQRVALKRVRTAGPAGRLVPRFLEERRILARLEHPGIARLVDGGVDADGVPWFAMEYVDGERIDTWCDARSLSVTRRLAVFRAVCVAVQYAHQQLVVHRDLKPSNILVAPDGQVRLLDFGIATLLAAGDASPFDDDDTTRTGTLAMTPQYAAPEQLRGDPVTAATDVYALGLLLFELLTGQRPYDVRGRSPAEVERIVTGSEAPAPSTTFEGSDAATRAAQRARARARGDTPDRLARALRGELDAIVSKALRKEPTRRYVSVAALLDDLDRHADGRPVLARPDSLAYRAQRFARRHWAGLSVGAAAMALGVAAFTRERTLRGRAEQALQRAQAVEEYMVGVFDVADPLAPSPARGEDVTARALLDRGLVRVERDLAGEPAVQAELRSVFGRVYSNLGLYDEAAQQATRALEALRRLHGSNHPDVAEALQRLGDIRLRQNRFDDAEPLLRQALEGQRVLLGETSRETATTLDRLATLRQEQGALDEAESLFRQALAARRGRLETSRDSVALGDALNNLAVLLFVKGAYAESERLQRETLALSERTLGPDHPLTAMTVQNLAQVLQLQGKLDEAETFFRRSLESKRRTLGDRHPSVTLGMNNFGFFLARERGKGDEADSLIRRALSIDREMFGERHVNVAAGLNNLANVARLRGEFAEAEALGREAVRIGRQVYAGSSKETAAYLNGLAAALYAQGKLDAAIPVFRESLAQYHAVLGAGHAFSQTVAVNLGRTLLERGALEEADSLFRTALATLDSTNAGVRGTRLTATAGTGHVQVSRGRAREVLPMLEAAHAVSGALFGAGHWRTAETATALGVAVRALGDRARGDSILQGVESMLAPVAREQPRLLALARLARATGSVVGSAAPARR